VVTKLVDPQIEQRLITGAQHGDIQAFNQLVEQYERLVFAVAYRLLHDYQHAEDVTQESFIRAYSSLHHYNGGSFRAWLTRIATNRCYDLLRGFQRRPAQSLDAKEVEEEPQWSVEPLPDSPERSALTSALGQRLERALDLLPEEQRLVVLLYDVHGYDYEEIAEIASISLGTVKSRLSRARSRLREMLRADKESRELFDAVRRHLSDDDSAGDQDMRQQGKAERTE
jgi:RNA polymerase sigma-70 factor (ECF subfamily)